MRANGRPDVCLCGKGYVSQWDGKCGHCRTKKEKEALYKAQQDAHQAWEQQQFRIRQREERHARNGKSPE